MGDNGRVSKVGRVAQAPGELETLRAFANTLRVAGPVDEIAEPVDLRRWLVARDLISPRAQVDGEDVARVARTRRAVRGLLAANAGLGEAAEPIREFNDVLDWVGAAPRLLAGQRTGIATDMGGLRGALGRLAAILLDGVNMGEFGRLKLCATPECRLAFYDHARNAAGRWCDMAVCGNRAKVAAYRSRRRDPDAGGRRAPREQPRSDWELLARSTLREERRR
jgi:predicted RNA-binding Zn ribbon-like protein